MRAWFVLFGLVTLTGLAGWSPEPDRPVEPVAPPASATMPDDVRRQLEEFNRIAREVDRTVRAARAHGNTLTALLALRAVAAERLGQNPMVDQAIGTLLMQAESELGNHVEALAAADIAAPGTPRGGTSEAPIDGWRPVDAIAAIRSLTKDRRVVMINEAHHVPQHRTVTLELLRALRDEGFTHFAAETLYESDVDLNERGYPTEQSGAYITEPTYASLIREALRLGYIVIPYEARNAALGERERGQAENLVERVFRDDPDARLLIHAGYAHIDESGDIAGAPTMAQELAAMLKVDPLTIDQTVMSERSGRQFEHPIYRRVSDECELTAPTVFLDDDGNPWTLTPDQRDVTLFLPRTYDMFGRPSWLAGLRGRMPAPIAETAKHHLHGAAGPLLVRAFCAAERAAPDAIPADQYVAEHADALPPLFLSKGEYVVTIEDASGRRIAEWTMLVGD